MRATPCSGERAARFEEPRNIERPLSPGDRAFAYWDPADADFDEIQARGGAVSLVPAGRGHDHREKPGWYLDAGRYTVEIARSADEVLHRFEIEVGKEAGPLMG